MNMRSVLRTPVINVSPYPDLPTEPALRRGPPRRREDQVQHVRLHDHRPGRPQAAREHRARLQQERPQVPDLPVPGQERHVPHPPRERRWVSI